MKKWITLLVAVLALTACQKVVFEHPQPRFWPGVPAFPAQIQGSYPLMGQENSVVVGRKTIAIKDERTYTLGEDLVLKRYQGYWIISLQNPQSKAWEVYALKDKKSIKTIQLNKSELGTINELLGREALQLDSSGDPLPLNIRRREFKKLLNEVFKGVGAP